MFLFMILLLIAIILAVVVVVGIAAFGSTAIVIFGDVIVCIVFIVLIMRWIIKRRK